MADRDVEILEATCRVIARQGMHDFRVEDVAREAGVSSALVYYYFKARDRLIAEAFTFADDRSGATTLGRMSSSATGRERVEFVLVHEITEDQARRENWIIWSETSAAAVFDAGLQASIERWAEHWVTMIVDLIHEGQQDGSIPRRVNAKDAAERLTAVVDSLGTKWMLGSMSERTARRLIRGAVTLELD